MARDNHDVQGSLVHWLGSADLFVQVALVHQGGLLHRLGPADLFVQVARVHHDIQGDLVHRVGPADLKNNNVRISGQSGLQVFKAFFN